MTIEYNKVGDYYFPNIKTNEQLQASLSKYGRMKLRYLKEHQRVLYSNLLTTGELTKYLQLVDQEANELYDKLMCNLKIKGISLKN